MEMDAKWKAWTNKNITVKANEEIKRSEADQAEVEKRKTEIEK